MTRTVFDGPNRGAFLDTLSWSEGTFGIGDDGYNVLVGSTKRRPSMFESYASHPNIVVKLNDKLSSTAAGRYQLLYRYWKAYIVTLNLSGFTPVVQDAIALQQIRERRALPDIDTGNFESAVEKCRNIWASLPGAGYGQREHDLPTLRAQFVKFGGVLA